MENKTYRELVIEYMNTMVEHENGRKNLSLPVPYLVMNLSCILASIILENNMGETIEDFIQIASHGCVRMLDSARLYVMLNGFLTYVLDKECEEEITNVGAWYDLENVVKLWNEFATEETSKENNW